LLTLGERATKQWRARSNEGRDMRIIPNVRLTGRVSICNNPRRDPLREYHNLYDV